VITGGRADLGDARSHQPAAKHAYFFNNHFVLLEYSSEHSAVSTVIQHSAFSRQHSALTPLSSISFPAQTFETQRNRGNGGFDNFLSLGHSRPNRETWRKPICLIIFLYSISSASSVPLCFKGFC